MIRVWLGGALMALILVGPHLFIAWVTRHDSWD